MKFIAIPGTNNPRSTNRTLLQYMQEHFKDQADIEIAEISEFPMFDRPESLELPEPVQDLVDRIFAADGVIISTPEYNHSFPGILTNALAWLSYGQYPFVNKPVMITGCAYGVLGSSRAQAHLRHALNAEELQARQMPGNEFLLGNSMFAFDETGQLKDPEKVAELEKVFGNFVEFVNLSEQLDEKQIVVDNQDKFRYE